MPLPSRAMIAAASVGATILPNVCIGFGAWHIGDALAEKVTGKDAVLMRPLGGFISGITTFGVFQIAGGAALRHMTPLTPAGQAVLSTLRPEISRTIFAGALIAGVLADC
ncbi:hypothetical protein SPRG_17566 [Saprolegnia parasitica CBS 223.65]|uniref:Uncharacterized protein n=1 Tax=Saprolegnia parasitica (strain CBS 223.65) TaxID=695850 RepID=A0A067BFQ9_SAPPC|nr:hypothetical protein SPRG_17566 [Saprolegnia parasitica CBS 223.65]KDO16993.1 hypothetical protein SPRG_17566 [Saprolegnia parasitica CBS 223.65]|eukprot:XP_012212301.1 hypothetical protein SPRG_17566 [Saprolegnia parasitica CBS 223.65]